MNIGKFVKQGKNIVIELDDEVEYILGDVAIDILKRGEGMIPLVRLFDGKERIVSVSQIEEAIEHGGVVDYLDKR